MEISKKRIKNFNLAIAFFLAFAGFYVALIVMANFGMRESSRLLSIPLRIIIVACLGIAFMMRPRIKIQNGLLFFGIFAFFYYIRIAHELLNPTTSQYILETEFFLYFSSFVVLPLFFVSQLKLQKRDYSYLLFAIILGCTLMSLVTYYYYQDLLGEVTRIAQSASKYNINPLALSYTSALGIGLSTSYLFTNNVKRINKLILYATIILCQIPFFLGASRGSIVALFVPFIFYCLFQKGVRNKLSIIIPLVSLCIIFIMAAQYLGFEVFNRFLDIREAIETGSATADRIDIWQSSMHQYIENPFFGNSLEVVKYGGYPHNILIETLISTGIFGFISYSLFLFYVFKKSIWIIKNKPSHFFIVVIFLQGFVQNMFSGGIYNTSTLAIGAGLVLGYDCFKTIR